MNYRTTFYFFLTLVIASQPAKAQLKIMPLGDSITQGEITFVYQNQSVLNTINEEQISYRADGAQGVLMAGTGGYRLYLEQMLVDMNWDIEMVGQRTEGGGNHEGYPGYTTSDLLAILNDILEANPPHIILLHIGTNDLPSPINPDSCYQNVQRMVDIIHAFNPDIKILLAQIIPCLKNSPLGEKRYPAIIGLNSLLPQIPQERDYTTLVDMWTPFVETEDWENMLMSGTYHPNDQGYYLMAEKWRDKLNVIIDGRSPLVTSLYPDRGYNTQADLQCTIVGDYFLDGITIYLHNNETSEILNASEVLFESTNQLHANFDLTQGSPGAWEVIAINSNHMRSIHSPRIIFTILEASKRANIFGTINYGNTDRHVPKVILTLTNEEGTFTDTTQNDGKFIFENILLDKIRLFPTKQGDHKETITGSDALLTLQYLAFLTDLTSEQFLATDVTEDDVVTGSDAQAILRYLAFYSDHSGSTGNWRFSPPDTSFVLNTDSQVDFGAFLLGDTNLSWGITSQKTSK